ncbi:hypothetical protein UlMin_035644 [Ulmus minor]
MVWTVNYQVGGWKKTRLWGGALLCWVFFLLATPKISHSPKHHLFADMRNFLGVPNTLNVITNFPFLVVGVLGFVLCVQGDFFNIRFPFLMLFLLIMLIRLVFFFSFLWKNGVDFVGFLLLDRVWKWVAFSSRGELWGWALFYAGIAGVAFGSAYYHLKPCDDRVMWDSLPMMIAYSSLFSSFVVERVGLKIGWTCLFGLLFAAFLCTAYERAYNDLKLCMMFEFIPFVAIPAVAFMFRPKYTHSRYWLWATGLYLLAKFEAVADRKIYNANHYVVSGHSLSHLCLAIVPVLLSIMLMYRNTKIQRLGDLRERP